MKPLGSPPTIRDLAAALKVSHTTVSLALRNDASISVKTRKRVQAAARKRGYRSNVLVSALLRQVRRGRLPAGGESIAFLPALPVEEWSKLPSVATGLAVARERAAQLGLRIEPFSIGERGERSDQVGRMLESRGFRGIVFPPLPLDVVPLRIPWNSFALVALGYSLQQVDLHRVANAHFNGMITCYRKLRDGGRKRIGLVLRRDDDDRARHYWLSGFLGASRIYGGARLEPLLMESPWDERAMRRWFARCRPDAIIGANRGALPHWLAGQGLGVPGDVAYACLDVFNVEEGRSLAGIRQSWGEIFTQGIELIAGQISRNELGLPGRPRVTLVDGEWCDGETV